MHVPEQSGEKNVYWHSEKKARETPESDEVSVCTERKRGRKKWTERLKTRKLQLLNCDLLLSLIRTFHPWAREHQHVNTKAKSA